MDESLHDVQKENMLNTKNNIIQYINVNIHVYTHHDLWSFQNIYKQKKNTKIIQN